jgi:hypothetical protein
MRRSRPVRLDKSRAFVSKPSVTKMQVTPYNVCMVNVIRSSPEANSLMQVKTERDKCQ